PLHPVLSGSLQSSCYYSASISTIPHFLINSNLSLNHQPFHGFNYTKKRLTIQRISELIEVLLSGNPLIFHAVIGFFRPHIQNKPNRKQIQIPDGNPQFLNFLSFLTLNANCSHHLSPSGSS